MVLKIGNIKLKNPLILAPMVDVTDLPYRLICRKAGAALAFTEMLYIDAILHENKKTKMLMKTSREDKPAGLQITGKSVGEFEEFVSRADLWNDYDLIDLNCGCPSLRIARKSGAGSFLMKEHGKIAAIVEILKKTKKPVSVKVRLGFEDNNVLEVAREVEKAGADAITVHGRLATEGGRVRADWSWIEKVKKAVEIPVIGNGDVVDGKSASEMLKICDGVMIARAAIGNPLVFGRILKYLESGKKLNNKSRSELKGEDEAENGGDNQSAGFCDNVRGGGSGENLKLLQEYLELQRKYYGDGVELGRIKFVGGRFLKKMKGAARMREEFHSLKRLKDIEGFVEKVSKSF